jgi:hypothetical protein
VWQFGHLAAHKLPKAKLELALLRLEVLATSFKIGNVGGKRASWPDPAGQIAIGETLPMNCRIRLQQVLSLMRT